MVVLGVTGAYLQLVTAQAKVTSALAQLESANAVLRGTEKQFQFGKVPQIDVNRSDVETLTQQQNCSPCETISAKQKINVARMIGLPVNDKYDTTDDAAVFTSAKSRTSRMP